MSQDIRYRERRYLIMMGIRLLCFVIAVVVFVEHGGWLTAIPAAGAIAIPYFAVVFANGGREPSVNRFRPYRPNMPERYEPPAGSGSQGPASGDGGTAAGNGGRPAGDGEPASGNAGRAAGNGGPASGSRAPRDGAQ
jgi:hypothetical protein